MWYLADSDTILGPFMFADGALDYRDSHPHGMNLTLRSHQDLARIPCLCSFNVFRPVSCDLTTGSCSPLKMAFAPNSSVYFPRPCLPDAT